jgi:hypothetical protein
VPEFGRVGRSVGYGWSAVVTRRTMRAAEDVREEVGTPSFTPASLFVAFVLPILRAHRTISREPLLRHHHHPHIHIEVGRVMIAFVGVATFDKPGKGATSILQAVIWVSPKRQLRNATLAPCCSYYASCAAARGAAVGSLGYQTVVMTYRIPRHIGFSPHSREGFVQEPVYVRLCGAEGEELTATLAYSRPKSLHAGYCAKSVRSAVSRSGRRMGLVGRL